MTQSKLTPLFPENVVEERKDAGLGEDLESGGDEEYGDEQRKRPNAEVVVELARLRRRGRRCRRRRGRTAHGVVIVVVAGVRCLNVVAVGGRDGRGRRCGGVVAVGSRGRGCWGCWGVVPVRLRSWDEFDGLILILCLKVA